MVSSRCAVVQLYITYVGLMSSAYVRHYLWTFLDLLNLTVEDVGDDDDEDNGDDDDEDNDEDDDDDDEDNDEDDDDDDDDYDVEMGLWCLHMTVCMCWWQ